jgi:hypothetical protein
MRLWHYTSKTHLPWIQESGYLKTTESNLHSTIQDYGPKVVWLLDTPDLQGSHGLYGSPVDKMAIRIEVEVPDHWVRSWLKWSQDQGISQDWLDIMIAAGGGQECADHWMVTFRTIKADRWVSVEDVEGLKV